MTSVTERSPGEDDFQLAAHSSRRLVKQSESHVRKSVRNLNGWVQGAPDSSPCGIDTAAARSGVHTTALTQRIEHVEAASNALAMHLSGLVTLLDGEVFSPLPAISIARSIAEVSASASWLLHPGINVQNRNARAYASLFRSLENTAASGAPRFEAMRSLVVTQLESQGVRVQYEKDRNGVLTDRVGQVLIGNGHAKTRFRYSDRVAEEIPQIANTYSAMSGMVHGEAMHIAAAYETPATYARLIGFVALRSVEAWSSAVHDWVGRTPAPFSNAIDWANLLESMPPELRARLEEAHGASTAD